MPLTSKGNEILSALIKQYGEKKGTSIFYAGINSGKFVGTHAGGDTLFSETVMLDHTNVKFTQDGYMVAEPRVARTGIQIYNAREVGKPDLQRMIKVYRPESEVFSQDSFKSFAHRPVTLDHPPEMVDANNWSKYAKGHTLDPIVRDGEFVRVPIMILDNAAINAYKGGKCELSMGYTCDLKWEPGETEDGEAYDAVQTNLRMNHLAIVGRARGGDKLRIGDTEYFIESGSGLDAAFTAQERQEAARKGQALPDGSYPIRNRSDLEHAIHEVGLGSAPHAEIKAHIEKRARELNAESMLPPDWHGDSYPDFGDTWSEAARAAAARAHKRGSHGDPTGLRFGEGVVYQHPNGHHVLNWMGHGNFNIGEQTFGHRESALQWAKERQIKIVQTDAGPDQTMVYCPDCQAEIPATDPVCPFCGHEMTYGENAIVATDAEFNDLVISVKSGNPYRAEGGRFGSGSGGGASGGSSQSKRTKTSVIPHSDLKKHLEGHGYYFTRAFSAEKTPEGKNLIKFGAKYPGALGHSGNNFYTIQEAVKHAASHAMQHNIPLLQAEEQTIEAPHSPTENIASAMKELRTEIFGEPEKLLTGKELGLNPRLKTKVFNSKEEAKRHIRLQRRHWIFARPIPNYSHVPLRGVKGWVLGTKIPGLRRKVIHGYTVHHTDEGIEVPVPWEIAFDEALDSLPLRDMDLTPVDEIELEDFFPQGYHGGGNPHHDPRNGQFTSGTGGPSHSLQRVYELKQQSQEEAKSKVFTTRQEALHHIQAQSAAWQKYHENHVKAVQEIVRQRKKWQNAKVIAVTTTERGHRRFGIFGQKHTHYTVATDEFPEIMVTDTELLEFSRYDELRELASA